MAFKPFPSSNCPPLQRNSTRSLKWFQLVLEEKRNLYAPFDSLKLPQRFSSSYTLHNSILGRGLHFQLRGSRGFDTIYYFYSPKMQTCMNLRDFILSSTENI